MLAASKQRGWVYECSLCLLRFFKSLQSSAVSSFHACQASTMKRLVSSWLVLIPIKIWTFRPTARRNLGGCAVEDRLWDGRLDTWSVDGLNLSDGGRWLCWIFETSLCRNHHFLSADLGLPRNATMDSDYAAGLAVRSCGADRPKGLGAQA